MSEQDIHIHASQQGQIYYLSQECEEHKNCIITESFEVIHGKRYQRQRRQHQQIAQKVEQLSLF